MSERVGESQSAGLLGPVALSGALLLLAFAPVLRGGNRHVALIVLEFLGLVVLAALWVRTVNAESGSPIRNHWLMLLVASPLLSLVQLIPLPENIWAALPGHALYAQAAEAILGVPAGWRALSISPQATVDTLLAGIPIIAALLVGYFASLEQLKLLLRVVVGLALAEVLLGLLQVAGGIHSPLYFGMQTYGPPIGTFANRNHYANYLAMALVAVIWLAYETNRASKGRMSPGGFTARHRSAMWGLAALVLVIGILLSRSRGAGLFGLPVAALALAFVALRINGWSRGWRFALPVMLIMILAALTLIGFDAATSRISADQLASSATYRGALARTSFDGALAFWPWGSGWGTYDLAYPPFQPAFIAGYANHAHMDYVEFLFEGGVLFVVFAAAFVWLAVRRASRLARTALRQRTLDREAMAALLCGLGLLGLLLHSLVEFNMRIPANAILGALLTGAFLRPLNNGRLNHDRPSQPYSSRY